MLNKRQNAACDVKKSIPYFYDALVKQNPEAGSFRVFTIKILVFLSYYFFRYITSFTSFTVRGTSGSAAATRLGA
jgi:hypothetical protein